MFVVRPAESRDSAALEALSAATPLVRSQPKTREAIGHAIERSAAAFGTRPDRLAEQSYFFVLEDTAEQEIAGAAALSATAGANGSFFAFRNDIFVQASRDLDISHNVHALTLCSGLSNWTQLSGFSLRQHERAGPEAALLSRARLLFAALAPWRFGDRFFASLPGVADASGRSPFWEALGRKFFQTDFQEAERIVGGVRNRTLIVELMPHYPVYVPLLDEAAQAALGQVHEEGALPLRILLGEGFEVEDYVDIFDGGPMAQAHRNALRSFSQSLLCPARTAPHEATDGDDYLVAAARDEHFRAVLAECAPPDESDGIALPPEALRALDVGSGDMVLCVKL